MIITRPRGEREFVVLDEREKPESEQTVFLVDDLTERERKRASDCMKIEQSDDGGARIVGAASRNYEAVKAGLRGWRNFTFEDGEPVPFETEPGSKRPTDETLALLPTEVKREIAEEILEQALPSEDDKGK